MHLPLMGSRQYPSNREHSHTPTILFQIPPWPHSIDGRVLGAMDIEGRAVDGIVLELGSVEGKLVGIPLALG